MICDKKMPILRHEKVRFGGTFSINESVQSQSLVSSLGWIGAPPKFVKCGGVPPSSVHGLGQRWHRTTNFESPRRVLWRRKLRTERRNPRKGRIRYGGGIRIRRNPSTWRNPEDPQESAQSQSLVYSLGWIDAPPKFVESGRTPLASVHGLWTPG